MPDSILPGSEVAFLLSDVTRLWRQTFERALANSELGLSPGEMRALVYVARENGVNQRQLAEIMSIEPMTLSAAIASLETGGLIRREVDPGDRRAKRIFTTPAAQAMLDAVAPIAAHAHAQALAGLDDQQKQEFTATLRRVRGNFIG